MHRRSIRCGFCQVNDATYSGIGSYTNLIAFHYYRRRLSCPNSSFLVVPVILVDSRHSCRFPSFSSFLSFVSFVSLRSSDAWGRRSSDGCFPAVGMSGRLSATAMDRLPGVPPMSASADRNLLFGILAV